MDKEIKCIKISDYYDGLEVLERREFRKAICKGTNMEYHSFMRRLRADAWSPFERAAIEELIKNGSYETQVNRIRQH